MSYKHTQISYPMIIITLAVLGFFVWSYITASAEPPSYNSGPNFAMTSTMTIIVAILTSFTFLQVIVDKEYIRIKFGLGIYRKKFALNEIASAKTAKNHRYYGWGIKVRFWPKIWIYSVAGFDAVELKMKNGKTYRIGTDEPKKLEQAIVHAMK